VTGAGPFTSAFAKLQGVMDALERDWANTKEHWEDSTSANLEKLHIEPLLHELRQVLEATVPLGESFAQARRACEPENP
jgi:hypothetical protein